MGYAERTSLKKLQSGRYTWVSVRGRGRHRRRYKYAGSDTLRAEGRSSFRDAVRSEGDVHPSGGRARATASYRARIRAICD